MTDTAEAPVNEVVAPQVTETPLGTEDNSAAKAVAEAVAVEKYDFVKDKYRAEGRSEDEAAKEQAKAYAALEKKLGGFTGAPEEYEVKLADELVELGVEFDDDDPVMQKLKEVSKNRGVNNELFNEILGVYAEAEIAKQAAQEQLNQEEIKAMGHEGAERIRNLAKWGEANLPPELYDGFMEAGVSANAIRAMEKLVSMTRNAPINPDTTTPAEGISESELKEMQFAKDSMGNRRIATDPAFKAEYDRKMKLKYGSGDYMQVVG